MSHRTTLAAIAIVLACGNTAAGDDLKRMSEGTINVWYPAGMKVQAKRVMAVAGDSIEP